VRLGFRRWSWCAFEDRCGGSQAVARSMSSRARRYLSCFGRLRSAIRILVGGSSPSGFEIKTRAFAGEPVDFAMRDPRSGRLLATVTSPFYGPKIFYTDDDPGVEWEQADGVALPEGGDQVLERIWVIARGEAGGTLYAGGDPGVLFESHDGGASWEINAGLWEQPSRARWQPGGGGLCLHSVCPWPGDPDKLAVAVSAAGMWLTEDGGPTRPDVHAVPRRRLPLR